MDLGKSLRSPIERQLIIRSFSDVTYPELIDIERRGLGFYAWGLSGTPQNVEHWFRMTAGDWLLVRQNDSYLYHAKILGRYKNSKAARAVWGPQTPSESLREYLVFLSEPMPIGLPCHELTDYLPMQASGLTWVAPGDLANISADFETLERFFRLRLTNSTVRTPVLGMDNLLALQKVDVRLEKPGQPANLSDEPQQKILNTILERRGPQYFRQSLLDAYGTRCAITQCNYPEVLEAACILPGRNSLSQLLTNCLLLRADVHTLFDLGKIAIDTDSMQVLVNSELMQTSYRIMAGRPVHLPVDESQWPSNEALNTHRRLAGL